MSTIVYFRFLGLFTTQPLAIALLVHLDYIFLLTGQAILGVTDALIVAGSIITVSAIARQMFSEQRALLTKTLNLLKTGELNPQQLHKTLPKEKLRFKELEVALMLNQFRVNHLKVAHFLVASLGDALVSPFFASALLGNLAYNAYSFMFIVVYDSQNSGSKFTPLMRAGFAVWQLMHATAFLSVAAFVVALNRATYACEVLISRILARTSIFHKTGDLLGYSRRSCQRERWKLAWYGELLDDGGASSRLRTRTLALGAGVFGALERRTMMEFGFIYVAFLLHFAGLISTASRLHKIG